MSGDADTAFARLRERWRELEQQAIKRHEEWLAAHERAMANMFTHPQGNLVGTPYTLVRG